MNIAHFTRLKAIILTFKIFRFSLVGQFKKCRKQKKDEEEKATSVEISKKNKIKYDFQNSRDEMKLTIAENMPFNRVSICVCVCL